MPYRFVPRGSYVSVDGMRVRFDRAGVGPTVLLLHGSGSSLDAFDEVAAALRNEFDVIRLDVPGFGLTGPRADRSYRIEMYVQFVGRFLDALDVEHCVVAGHSLGGNIAWNLAVAEPNRVRRLVLMNATGYDGKSLPFAFRLARRRLTRPVLRLAGSRRAVVRNLRRLGGPGFRPSDELVDRVHELMKRPGALQAFVDLAMTDQAVRTADLRGLRVPTLVLRGDRMDGQHFARDIAGCVDVVLPGVGHLMPEEAPDRVAAEIRAFAGVEL